MNGELRDVDCVFWEKHLAGRGFEVVIRERFGVGWAVFAVGVILVANGGLIVSEFVGIGAATELLGVSKLFTVPTAAALIFYLVVFGFEAQALVEMEVSGVGDPRGGEARPMRRVPGDRGEDAAPLIARGSWQGRIGTHPAGAGGFGYAPLFVPEGHEVTAAELPITLSDAVDLAVEQGPQYRVARAAERAASAQLRSRQSDYLPTFTATGSHTRFDTKLFPGARTVSSIDFGISLPIWNNGQREIAVSQARVSLDVAEAIRADLERAALADVTQAYEAYTTARATVDLQQTAVLVARENYRVQDVRYRSGASTILDLLSGQVTLAEAEAALVQSRFSARLALAGLEAIVGRRLFEDRVLP